MGCLEIPEKIKTEISLNNQKSACVIKIRVSECCQLGKNTHGFLRISRRRPFKFCHALPASSRKLTAWFFSEHKRVRLKTPPSAGVSPKLRRAKYAENLKP